MKKTKKKKKLSKLAKSILNEMSRYWKLRALSMWSQVVRSRGKVCLICGTAENLNAHHVISAVLEGTKFETTNGVCVCCKHHKFASDISFHKQPFAAILHLQRHCPEQYAWLLQNYGRKYLETYKKSYDRLCKELETVEQKHEDIAKN